MCTCTADWPLVQLTAIPQQLVKMASASSVVKRIISILTVGQYIKPTVQDGSTADSNNYFVICHCTYVSSTSEGFTTQGQSYMCM